MPAPDPKTVLAGLWRSAGHDDAALRDVHFTGAEPVLPSSFAVGTAAQATIGAAALAAAELWRLRTGRRQSVGVDMRHAAVEFRSERYLARRRQSGRTNITTTSPVFIAAATAAGRGCTPICRIIAAVFSNCSALPHDKAAVQRALDGWHGRNVGDRGRRSRSRRHRVPIVRRMGSASARPSGREAAAVHYREDRRGAAETARRGGAAARRHQSARPHPHHRRSGLRPHARRAWRRCAACHRVAFGGDAAAGHGYRPGKIVGVDRSARCRRTRNARGARAQGRYFRAGLSARRHRRARFRSARRCAAAARHRLCLAMRIWA